MWRATRTAALAGAFLVLSLTLAAPVVLAHVGATGVVKERMMAMEALGDALKAISEMMRGKRAYDAAAVARHADEITRLGGDAMTKLFPEGSIEGPSEARPTVWRDWDDFTQLADQLSAYAAALGDAADNPRAAGGAPTTMMGGGGMMGTNNMMMGGGGMMMSGSARPDPEHVAGMPPDAAFFHVSETCTACHQRFRQEK